MITFGFCSSSFEKNLKIDSKINPSKSKNAYAGFIIWKIKGVAGSLYTPQPHSDGNWSWLCDNKTAPILTDGKCKEAHAKMILEYIQGRKWQSRIKKAYSARNRWVNGKPV